jgi:uncharacterized protein (TIGR02265 family)
MAEGQLVYDFGVESLFRGLGERLTPALKEKVRAVGIDLDRKLLPAYPRAVWVRAVDVVAEDLSRGGDLATARRELGRLITGGFPETALGKLMVPGVRFIGVRRVLLRLPKQLTMSNNFMKVSLVEQPGDRLRVEVIEPVPSPEFLCGVIEAIATYAGAKRCEVTFVDEGPLTAFTVNWS